MPENDKFNKFKPQEGNAQKPHQTQLPKKETEQKWREGAGGLNKPDKLQQDKLRKDKDKM